MAGSEAEEFLGAIDQSLAQEDWEDLEADLTEGEVEGAMYSLKSDVAPGGMVSP